MMEKYALRLLKIRYKAKLRVKLCVFHQIAPVRIVHNSENKHPSGIATYEY